MFSSDGAPSSSDDALNDILSITLHIARGAGTILREGLVAIQTHRDATLKFKSSDIDPVTEYDVRSEKHIVTELQQHFPEHRIVGEEGGAYASLKGRSTAAHYEWHIDPLDGTVNFAHGFPIFCVSMGLLIDGVPAVGVVFNPASDEMYAAARGHGATCNGAPIRVSRTPTLKRALLVTGFPYDTHTTDSNLAEFVGFQHATQATRRLGSAALDMCYVASGQMDGYWEMKIKPHDIAAGILLIREAGGVVTDFDGADAMLDTGEIVGSNGLLQADMLAVIRQTRASETD
jgi:myo-inositol-1(or 4)-monophosphatase